MRTGWVCRRAAAARRTAPREPLKNAPSRGKNGPVVGKPLCGLLRVVKMCAKVRPKCPFDTPLETRPHTAAAFAPRCFGTRRTRAAPAPPLAAHAGPSICRPYTTVHPLYAVLVASTLILLRLFSRCSRGAHCLAAYAALPACPAWFPPGRPSAHVAPHRRDSSLRYHRPNTL